MAERADSYAGRLGIAWRVRLEQNKQGGMGWLYNRSTSSVPQLNEALGPFSTLSEAMKDAETEARRLVKEKMGEDPGPITDRKPLRTFSYDRSKEYSGLQEVEFVRESRLSRISSFLPVFVGVAAGITGLFMAFAARIPNFYHQQIENRVNDVERTSQVSRAELEAVQAKLAALTKMQTTSPSTFKMDDALVGLRTDTTALKARLDNYEVALGEDPAKRLAVAMLRKDLDTLRDEHKADSSAMHEEMSRTFDLMKWLLGLVGAGSLISGISAFFSKSRAAKQAAPD